MTRLPGRKRNFVFKLAADRAGSAAVEFAFIAPILVVMILGIFDVGRIAVEAARMQMAIRASIQYALAGGENLAAAKDVGIKAWGTKPSNGTLSVTQFCKCGAASATCGQICADGSYQQIHLSATASGLMGGSFVSIQKSTTKTVRLR